MRRLGPILCLWLAALVVPAAAAPLAHREVLPNGIVLLVAERPTIPIVVARLYTRAGSVYDPPDAGGLANLTADMLTRGTAQHTAPELDGATVSLSVLKKDLRLGLDLLAEVVLTPTFPEAELKRRSEEIAANIERSEQDPGTVASRLMAQLLFPGHPYSRPVTGTVESVKKLTREQVVAFYRMNYRPDATIVAVVGDVTRDEVRSELLSRLGGWAAPGTPRPAIPTTPAAPPAESREVRRELTQATVSLARPGIKQDHPDYFSLVVANYILGGGSAS